MENVPSKSLFRVSAALNIYSSPRVVAIDDTYLFTSDMVGPVGSSSPVVPACMLQDSMLKLTYRPGVEMIEKTARLLQTSISK